MKIKTARFKWVVPMTFGGAIGYVIGIRHGANIGANIVFDGAMKRLDQKIKEWS